MTGLSSFAAEPAPTQPAPTPPALPFIPTFTPDDAAKLCGVIEGAEKFTTEGSGFVFGPQHDVVTCWHVKAVADNTGETNLLYLNGTNRFRISPKYMLPNYDLAVFTASPHIECPRTRVGDFKKMRPGDFIIYLGFDSRQSDQYKKATGVNISQITAVGSALNDNGVIVDFLEFPGVAIPGYSGGPVFNKEGEVVAIIREAWTKKGIKGGAETLMNRAFSIEILSILDGQIQRGGPSQANGTNTTQIGALDILDFATPKTETQK